MSGKLKPGPNAVEVREREARMASEHQLEYLSQ
jgi:hypothetical protein